MSLYRTLLATTSPHESVSLMYRLSNHFEVLRSISYPAVHEAGLQISRVPPPEPQLIPTSNLWYHAYMSIVYIYVRV